nr:basic proline-rich protein-like [Procambarus clarkii]
MSASERKSFCIESLLSREAVAGGGGRSTLSPADLTSHDVTSPPHTPPLSPLSSPHSSPLSISPAVTSSAMLNRATLLGGATGPLMHPHLYQYPGMGMPPGLLPAHAFTPTASPLLDAQAFNALKSGAGSLPPAALDWFARAGLMYPRLPPELTGQCSVSWPLPAGGLSPRCNTRPGAPAPGAPVPGTAAPGTQAPGAPAPGTPAPGAPAPGAPAPGTPAPGAPAPGTPAPGTPVPGAPVPGTAAPGAPAPRYLAPRHLAPRHLAPRHLAPRHLAPRHLAPRHLAPRHLAPRHPAPRQRHNMPQRRPVLRPGSPKLRLSPPTYSPTSWRWCNKKRYFPKSK